MWTILSISLAFNALISSSIVLQEISFVIPVALLLYRKRSPKYLPQNRGFAVSPVIGWTANVIVVVFAIVTTVFFNMPSFLPATASSMSESTPIFPFRRRESSSECDLLLLFCNESVCLHWEIYFRLYMRHFGHCAGPRRGELVRPRAQTLPRADDTDRRRGWRAVDFNHFGIGKIGNSHTYVVLDWRDLLLYDAGSRSGKMGRASICRAHRTALARPKIQS